MMMTVMERLIAMMVVPRMQQKHRQDSVAAVFKMLILIKMGAQIV